MRITNYARAIMFSGIDCKVIIAKRTEPCQKKDTMNTLSEGTYNGVHFQYVAYTPIRDKSLLKRKLNDICDIFATVRILKRELSQGDVILGYLSEHPFLVRTLQRAARRQCVKYFSELCEYPYQVKASLSIADRIARHYVIHREFARYDGVLAISKSLSVFAEKWTGPSCKVVDVPIVVDYDTYKLPDKSDSVPVPYIFHCGTLYEHKDGFCSMLEAFGHVVQSGINLRFISTGLVSNSDCPEKIQSIITRFDISNKVEFLGYVNDERKRELLSGASLVIINKPDNLQNQSNFSTKLAEYLAASKPVIHTRVGEAMNYLVNGRNAVVITPGDTEELVSAIKKCINDRSFAKGIAEKGRALCEEAFDYKAISGKLYNAFKS